MCTRQHRHSFLPYPLILSQAPLHSPPQSPTLKGLEPMQTSVAADRNTAGADEEAVV